jgi:hypothetical protein
MIDFNVAQYRFVLFFKLWNSYVNKIYETNLIKSIKEILDILFPCIVPFLRGRAFCLCRTVDHIYFPTRYIFLRDI